MRSLSKVDVFVSSGYSNKLPWTGGLNDKHTFLTVLKAGTSEIEPRADSAYAEGPLPGSQMTVSSQGRKQRKLSGVSFTGHCSHSWRLHSHDLITSQRPHLQILSHWELDFNMSVSRGHRHVVYREDVPLFYLKKALPIIPWHNTFFSLIKDALQFYGH